LFAGSGLQWRSTSHANTVSGLQTSYALAADRRMNPWKHQTFDAIVKQP
jgi:hypothetical protein